jgi:hypothetical protein
MERSFHTRAEQGHRRPRTAPSTMLWSSPPTSSRRPGADGPDVHGRRFLVGVGKATEPPPPITRLNLVHNWFEELKRLAPNSGRKESSR